MFIHIHTSRHGSALFSSRSASTTANRVPTMNRIVDTATEHELRAFLKHRKKELRLTDEECLCLRIRRRRLSLERKRPPATLPLPRYCGPGRKQKVSP